METNPWLHYLELGMVELVKPVRYLRRVIPINFQVVAQKAFWHLGIEEGSTGVERKGPKEGEVDGDLVGATNELGLKETTKNAWEP